MKNKITISKLFGVFLIGVFILSYLSIKGDITYQYRSRCIVAKYKIVARIYKEGSLLAKYRQVGCIPQFLYKDYYETKSKTFTQTQPIVSDIYWPTYVNIYPSTLNVTGIPANARVSDVTFNQLWFPHTDFLDILLVAPNGQFVTLTSDVNCSYNGNALKFSDDGGPLYNCTGWNSYHPYNYGCRDSFDLIGIINDCSPKLSNFTGDPNGSWKLYVMNNDHVQPVQLNGWSINFSWPVIKCHIETEYDGTIYDASYVTDTRYSYGLAFIPQPGSPIDSNGIAKSQIMYTVDIVSDATSSSINLTNFTGELAVKNNSTFGSSFRVIVWKGNDSLDYEMTANKVLYDGSVRIENGQVITNGIFSQNDFIVSTGIDSITGQNVLRLVPAPGLSKTISIPDNNADNTIVVATILDSGAGIYDPNAAFRDGPDAIPTLSQWGLIILGIILLIVGIFFIRRRQLQHSL